MSNIQPQVPAEGIMLRDSFGNFKSYKVSCQCGNPDDDIVFDIDLEDNDVVVSTYTKQKTRFWEDKFNVRKTYGQAGPEWWFDVCYLVRSALNSLWHRLKITKTVWINGYVEYEQTTIMTAQQARNYAAALNSAVDAVEENRRIEGK